jgi:hypothetical protein
MIANPHNMYLPGLESVSYPPKQINTVAVKVTPENIGALSIEFESELLYTGPGLPHFYADFERIVGGEKTSVAVEIRLGDWIVVLWDEFRMFRDHEFQHTFHRNVDAELLVDHNLVPPISQGDFAPGGRGLMDPMATENSPITP